MANNYLFREALNESFATMKGNKRANICESYAFRVWDGDNIVHEENDFEDFDTALAYAKDYKQNSDWDNELYVEVFNGIEWEDASNTVKFEEKCSKAPRKKKSLGESVQLNEGPGAGIEIECDIDATNVSITSVNASQIKDRTWGELRVLEFEGNLEFELTDFVASTYYKSTYDSGIERMAIKAVAHKGLFLLEDDDEMLDANTLAEELLAFGGKIHTWYGGGWSYSHFDGSINEGDWIDDSYNYMSIKLEDLKIVDEEIIDEIDYLVDPSVIDESLNESSNHYYVSVYDVDENKYPLLEEALNCGGISLIVYNDIHMYNEQLDVELLEDEGINVNALIKEVKKFAKDMGVNFILDLDRFDESLNKKSLTEGFWKHFDADEQYPEEWCFVQSEGSMSAECSIIKHSDNEYEIRSGSGRYVGTEDSLTSAQTKAASVFDLGGAE